MKNKTKLQGIICRYAAGGMNVIASVLALRLDIEPELAATPCQTGPISQHSPAAVCDRTSKICTSSSSSKPVFRMMPTGQISARMKSGHAILNILHRQQGFARQPYPLWRLQSTFAIRPIQPVYMTSFVSLGVLLPTPIHGRIAKLRWTVITSYCFR